MQTDSVEMTSMRRILATLALTAGVVVTLWLTSSPASATALDPGTRSPDAARIATGAGFSCAIDDGAVQCWGSGAYGELGNGATTDVMTPPGVDHAVDLGGTAIQVVAGDHHACALLSDGSVRCWGRNNDGQLGYANTNPFQDSPNNPSPTPADAGAVSVGRTAIAISAGGNNTCALLNNGGVRCWGYGADGENGSGHTANIGDDETPGSVPSLDLTNQAIAITTGNHHSCALFDDGTVRCWGKGATGQLGYGNTSNNGDNESPSHAGTVDLGGSAVAISAGGDHTCALMDSGMVRCWGSGLFGELGIEAGVGLATQSVGDDEKPNTVPVVSLGTNRTAVAISAGADHTCAVLDNGTVRCWGAGNDGRLGYGGTDDIGDNELPSSVGPVDLGGPAIAVSAGVTQTCARLGDGTLRCWGSGAHGQLGYGDTNGIGWSPDDLPSMAGPIETGARPEVRQVATGSAHTCALASDGTVRCWGHGAKGQLGYGNTDDIGDDELPSTAGTVDVGGPVKQITAGGDHTCALRADGKVYCWGDGTAGDLGYGNTNDIGDDKGETPASVGAVPLGSSALAITAGDEHTCALSTVGAVRCWGYGADGRLGYANTRNVADTKATVPSAMPAVPVGGEVRTLSAGPMDTCAILANGDSRCWGDNGYNQLGYGNTNRLGDNETPDKADPISLGDNRRALGFAQGQLYTCATMDNGAVRCWGGNPSGVLGYGNTKPYTARPTSAGPVSFSGNPGRYSRLLHAGHTHTCVVMDNGQMVCWGYNVDGRLGISNPGISDTATVGDDEYALFAGPVNVGAGRQVVSISLGDEHTCAVLDDGTLRCWGAGSLGRLGTGNTRNVGDGKPGDAKTSDASDIVHLFDIPPVAVHDSLTVNEDAAATPLDVLANDTDADGGPKFVAEVSQPAHGTVVIAGNESDSGVFYQPDADYCGSDSFGYALNGGSHTTVAVTITCVDDPPTAVDDATTVTEDADAQSIDVLANDTDSDGGPKAVDSVTQPDHGTATITDNGTGVTYKPAPNFCGTDSFTYTLDGGSTATVTITVTCIDDPPTAVDDTTSVEQDSAAQSIDVLTNDTDIDGGPKTVDSITQPGHGTATITDNGTSVSYKPAAKFCGDDSFSYTLNGGSEATVRVTVTCAEDAPPVAVDDTVTVAQDAAETPVDVLANDTDTDGGPKQIDTVTQPDHGTATITDNGTSVSYKPDTGYCNDGQGDSPDTFTYSLNGGSTATVTVTVACAEVVPPPDTTAPDTTLTSAPQILGLPLTLMRRLTFTFASSEPGSTFECRLDAGAFVPCTSPYTTTAALGFHSFAVRARDAAGNVDPTPATAGLLSLGLF